MEVEQTAVFVPLKGFEKDYEIMTEYPFMIKNKHTGRILKEWIDKKSGYIRVTVNGKNKIKHQLIANQFIPNPNNLPEIDHINHNRTDYHLENLRWVSKSENNKNLSYKNGVSYQYVDSISYDAILVDSYETKNEIHYFENYYYYDGLFYFYNGVKYRILYVNTKLSGLKSVNFRDINNQPVSIYYTKFKEQYNLI